MTMKKAPAVKAGGAGGMPAGKQMKAARVKKPMPAFLAAVLSFFVFLLLLAGGIACLYFNVGGIAGQAITLLPQYGKFLEGLETQKADIAARELALTKGGDDLAAVEKALEKRRADLDRSEEKLKTDREEFDAMLKQADSESAGQQLIIDIYTGMDPSKAADMLDKANTLQEAAAILKLLPSDAITEILEAMDSKKALELTKLLRH